MWENKGHRPYWALLHVYALTKPLHELTGFSYKKPIFHIDKHGINRAFFHGEEMKHATAHFETWLQNEDRIALYFEELQRHFSHAQKTIEENLSRDWSKLSEDSIIKEIQTIASLHGFKHLFVTQPQHVEPLETALKVKLQGNPATEKILAHILTAGLPLPFDAEREEIVYYRNCWKTYSESEKETILHYFVQKYGFMGAIEGEVPYGKEHYEKEITSEQEERKERMYEQMENLDHEIKKLGQRIAKLSNQRIWSRWYGMRLRYCIKAGIIELGRRWNIADIEYATLPEIERYVATRQIDKEIMIARKMHGYIATIIDDHPVLLTGKDAEPYLSLIMEDISQTEEIHGHCANPGKIIGNVRIISFAAPDYHQQIAAFQNGEILVTGMTRPQIAHLCNKASAIITDEGGITSHASIISREFNIPCIIGTKNATKILKTGDKVELDATLGIARIVRN